MAGSDVEVSPMNLFGCRTAASLEPQPRPFTSGQLILVPSHPLPSALQGWDGTLSNPKCWPVGQYLGGN